ncbi:DUF7715 family protein [Naasia lichenicola]|uniref:DUF7715 domain-containing protein n=1 Tax=Naasia lichenicola TaxID=2565933 RepID=A0A4S4FNE2_9MICO|nr:hypothetical protein [Naasia lichenicola]THG31761.1 hypothetical protein E6C64_06800 [Naasia lichenicola]
MHVFVATRITQGRHSGDYFNAIDGELVIWDSLGARNHSPEDDCPCLTSFLGVTSERPTTTAMVVDRPDLSFDEYMRIIHDSFLSAYRLHDWDLEAAEMISLRAAMLQPRDIVHRNRSRFSVRLGPSRPSAFQRKR